MLLGSDTLLPALCDKVNSSAEQGQDTAASIIEALECALSEMLFTQISGGLIEVGLSAYQDCVTAENGAELINELKNTVLGTAGLAA